MTTYYYEVDRPDWDELAGEAYIEAEADAEAVDLLRGLFSDLSLVYTEEELGTMRVVWSPSSGDGALREEFHDPSWPLESEVP